mgnify:CR=1 FL=1
MPLGLTVDEWLRAAQASAAARGLPELSPLLDGVAAAMRVVRGADWSDVSQPTSAAARASAVTDRPIGR